jgi:predicted  nucleic acid-binding Zn-ribbon protein
MNSIIIALFITALVVICILCFNINKINTKAKGQITEEDVKELKTNLNEKDSLIEKLKSKISSLENNIEEAQTKIEKSENAFHLLSNGNESGAVKEIIASLDKYKEDISKLKKQLEDVQEELEDTEDDAKDYKKKCEKQKLQLNELTQRLTNSEKELEDLRNSLKEKCTILEDVNDKLSRKQRSLNFVNEILQAKDADDKDIKDLNSKISAIVEIVTNDLCENIEELKKSKKKIENDLWKWANLQHKTWLQKNKVIAFVGEFSAGKTSIVNRILSQDNSDAPKLPVSSKATTAIPTYISYGREFFSQFTTPEGKLKNIDKESFEKVNKELLDEVNVSPLIQYFVMSYNNQNLQNLSILDTPGFNSNDKEDAQRTADVIHESDALFWVFDANSGEINKSSISTIHDNLQDLPLFIVINKTDTKSPGELKELEDHIKDTISKNEIEVAGYLRFSKEEPISNLMNTISSVPHDNSKNEFLNKLYITMLLIVQEANDNLKKAKIVMNQCLKKEAECVQEFTEIGDEVYDACYDISNKPTFKKRWKILGGDHYDMDKDDFDSFIGYLNDILAKIENSKELNSNLQDLSKETENAKNEYEELKLSRNTVEYCLKKLEKAINALDINFKDKIQAFNGELYYTNIDSQNSSIIQSDEEKSNNNKSNELIVSSSEDYGQNNTEQEFIKEITNQIEDRGRLTEEDIPLLLNLAKAYKIKKARAKELINSCTDIIPSDNNNTYQTNDTNSSSDFDRECLFFEELKKQCKRKGKKILKDKKYIANLTKAYDISKKRSQEIVNSLN